MIDAKIGPPGRTKIEQFLLSRSDLSLFVDILCSWFGFLPSAGPFEITSWRCRICTLHHKPTSFIFMSLVFLRGAELHSVCVRPDSAVPQNGSLGEGGIWGSAKHLVGSEFLLSAWCLCGLLKPTGAGVVLNELRSRGLIFPRKQPGSHIYMNLPYALSFGTFPRSQTA